MGWYLNFNSKMTDVPNTYEKLPYISAINPGNLLSEEKIASLVEAAPAGSYWYVGGEPNRTSITGAQFADVFHYYYTNIKAADREAKITGPSILNWDFTCIGCGGYQRGKFWLKDFIDTYEDRYGQKPPVDVWAIDIYPIDWVNTPNNDPHQQPLYSGIKVPHWYIAIMQLEGMRQYLDDAGYADTPIWITEIAIHVGYDGWIWAQLDGQLVPKPFGKYHWDKMSSYVNTVLDWLEENSDASRIERWFFYKTWRDIVDVGSDGYMGIIFFDGPSEGASLNCLGEVYRARSLGLERVRCDAQGNTVLDG